MKKLLALLIGICLIVPAFDASAKAVKLGRGKTVTSNAGGRISGKTSIGETEKKCDSSCATCDKKTGKCLTCPTNMRLDNGKCYNVCSGVSCISSNYSPNVTDKGCCCERITCPSGQRLLNGTCINACSGVKCAAGYTPTASGNKCCCESSCGTGKVYNPTIGKCVDQICPSGCADMCVTGCNSCSTGYYLDYDNGRCPLCSDKIANCAKCTSKAGATSGTSVTCTACADGYKLSGGKCVASCPTGCSSCSSSSTCTGCDSGYYLSSGSCLACPENATCKGGTETFICDSGYLKSKSGKFCTAFEKPNFGSGCSGNSDIPSVCPNGTTRTSRGCCPPNATNDYQCFKCAVTHDKVGDNTKIY